MHVRLAALAAGILLAACSPSRGGEPTGPTNGGPGDGGAGALRPGRYAAPDGSSGNAGTAESPWDLATALAGGRGAVVPGDTIWLRGGVYRGDFRSALVGTAARHVVVRQLPGERATIEGRLRADGAHATFWGFEIRQADALATDWPALEAYGEGTRFVNLVIHDAGENGISFRTTAGVSEVYGCIVFNNGNDEHLDQGIYAPSDAGEKWISDNVFFTNLASGIQVFSDDSHPRLVNVHVVGNISFNNSYIASVADEENLTLGGQVMTDSVEAVGNVLYFSRAEGRNMVVGLDRVGTDNRGVVVRDNYAVGGESVLRMHNWQRAEVSGNVFAGPARLVRLVGATGAFAWRDNEHRRDPGAPAWNAGATWTTFDGWRTGSGVGGTDRVVTAAPGAARVFVRPNRYERGRAHIAVVNWPLQGSVAVDVSQVLAVGDRYEVRNVQDVFGAPVASGTYAGGTITLRMSGVTPPAAVGRAARAPRTAPDFDAFLLTVAPAR